MRFYAGIYFPDGKPVPVGFERKTGESKLLSGGRRVTDEAPLYALKYSDEQVKARTPLQNYLSQRNDGSIPGGVVFSTYDDAMRERATQDPAKLKTRTALLNEYLAYLTASFPKTDPKIQTEIAAVKQQILNTAKAAIASDVNKPKI